jgi:hypothetical protein
MTTRTALRSARRTARYLVRGARVVLGLGATLSPLWLLSSPAAADCGPPPFELLWTYPENGAVDVPTNAVLRSLASTWQMPRVTLDGVDVPVAPSDEHEGLPLGTLMPNHDYRLRLDYASPTDVDAGAARVAEITFRTGAGPATKPPPVALASTQRASSSGESFASPCPEVVAAQDCFDQGQDTLLTFDVPPSSGPGYLVDGELWPARCGDPMLFTSEYAATSRCHEVRAIGPGGLLSDVTRACPPPVSDAGTDASIAATQSITATAQPATASDSCSVDASKSSRGLSVWLLLGVGLWFTRRRAVRAHEV